MVGNPGSIVEDQDKNTGVQNYKTFINYLFNFFYEHNGNISVSSAKSNVNDTPLSKNHMKPYFRAPLSDPILIQTYFNECPISYKKTNNHPVKFLHRKNYILKN